MEFAELKYSLLKAAVMNGWTKPEEVTPEFTEGIPPELIVRWMTKLQTPQLVDKLPVYPRLINRFTMGADPEFTFLQSPMGAQISAMKLGLQTGLAFGMDMNGRLAELRPTPSRFVFDIIASILAELRWMAILKPHTMTYDWVARPFDGQDGVGGHVHFARKRNENIRQQEISRLCNLQEILLEVNVFDGEICRARRQNSKYGDPYDFRLQKHGYEYRALPTWLCSPWMAYFTLVMSKLALHQPDIIKEIRRQVHKNPKYGLRALTNFLGFYKNMDDDAAIAFKALKNYGLPKYDGGDFRAAWGILYPRVQAKASDRFFPTMINGSEIERMSLFDYLVNKVPIKPELPICNWEPQVFPKGYTWMMNYVNTYHQVGTGEIVSRLVCSDKAKVQISVSEGRVASLVVHAPNNNYRVGARALQAINIGEKCLLDYQKVDGDVIKIHLPRPLREFNRVDEVKKVLTSGLFPIWNVEDVKLGSYEEWVKLHPAPPEHELIGKALGGDI